MSDCQRKFGFGGAAAFSSGSRCCFGHSIAWVTRHASDRLVRQATSGTCHFQAHKARAKGTRRKKPVRQQTRERNNRLPPVSSIPLQDRAVDDFDYEKADPNLVFRHLQTGQHLGFVDKRDLVRHFVVDDHKKQSSASCYCFPPSRKEELCKWLETDKPSTIANKNVKDAFLDPFYALFDLDHPYKNPKAEQVVTLAMKFCTKRLIRARVKQQKLLTKSNAAEAASKETDVDDDDESNATTIDANFRSTYVDFQAAYFDEAERHPEAEDEGADDRCQHKKAKYRHDKAALSDYRRVVRKVRVSEPDAAIARCGAGSVAGLMTLKGICVELL